MTIDGDAMRPTPAQERGWGNDYHYRALFEQSDDYIFIINFDLRYISANPQALALLGYEENELAGMPVSQVVALDEESEETEAGQGEGLADRDLRCKDGRLVPVEISTSLVYDQDGLPAYILSIARDITRRKQAEQELRLSVARQRSIIAALPDLIIILDGEGRIQDYSARPDHPLYRAPGEVNGRGLDEIWPGDVVKLIVEDAVGADGADHHLREFRLPGSQRTYESRHAHITEQESLLVIRDITEKSRLDEMKSDFINRASHELRTPLTTVIMMANLIQEGGEPREMREYWSVMMSELNRQKILIERLLIAGRLESGTMKLELLPVDLAACLEESILAVRPIAQKKNIEINLTRPPLNLIVQGDKSGLQQVFINLINNAVKFSPRGSSVTVDITLGKEEARVAISDQGMGIPPEDLPHLFERFFRARNVTIAEIPGSGIGLYIVRSIVEELHGHIEVKSTLSKGTTFIIHLNRLPSSAQI